MGAPKRGVGRYGADIGLAISIGKGQEMGVKSVDIYFHRSSGNGFGRVAKIRLCGERGRGVTHLCPSNTELPVFAAFEGYGPCSCKSSSCRGEGSRALSPAWEDSPLA